MKHCIKTLTLISIILSLFSCSVHKINPNPVIKLEVQPLDSIYIYYNEKSSLFRIGNEFIERTIFLDKKANRIYTTTFLNKSTQHNYINSLGEEFSFRINGTQISGITGNVIYKSHQIFSQVDAKGLELSFDVKLENIGTFSIRLLYEVYDHIPVIRKWIEIENKTGSSIAVDSVLMESIRLLPGIDFDIDIRDLSEYLRNKKFRGLSTVVFNTNLKEGFIIGNETPGILKYNDVYSKPGKIGIGMTQQGGQYVPQIQITPKEIFSSPGAFVFLFTGEPEQSKDRFEEFMFDYLLVNQSQKNSIQFENINPDINEAILIEKVKQTKNSGIDIFCISGNWTDRRGDWTYEKNPYIKNIAEYTHSLGMKFGLCIDLSVAETESIILDQHSQWTVKLKNGSDYEISDNKTKLMCLGSEYALYMAYEIDAIVKELNLDYIKLTGEILPIADKGGCFAVNHLHKTSLESLWYIYDGLFAIMKYLHVHNPNLIIDIDLDSYNPSGLIDYALLMNANINWQ
ncbi:TPA: hypothetical protein ENS27_01100 [bacterium]|nr:hypothetical protein [bacterium]